MSSGTIRRIDTGPTDNAYLIRVSWLGDDRRLAVQTLNRAQNSLDLLLADAVTGRSHKLIHEEDRYWINIADGPYFLNNQRFLWLSERTGYRHVFLYDLSGKMVNQLSRGNWNVDSIEGVDQINGWVYVTAGKRESSRAASLSD